MAMSDCIKCWDTPCRCGLGYQEWSEKDLKDQIAMLQKVLESKSHITVRLQLNPEIAAQYRHMILKRETERLVGFSKAVIVDSGLISAVDQEDGKATITIRGSDKRYTLPGATWVALDTPIGAQVVIVTHHKHHYIIKSPVLVEPTKTESN